MSLIMVLDSPMFLEARFVRSKRGFVMEYYLINLTRFFEMNGTSLKKFREKSFSDYLVINCS